MRGADGFEDAVMADEFAGGAEGGGHGDLVAGGDVEGFDAVAGAEDPADVLAIMFELHGGAGAGAGRAMGAAQAGLGAADRGAIEPEAEMGRGAEAARMGEAVAVDEEEIGDALEFAQRAEDDGGLAEGEKAGDVGEGGGKRRARGLDEFPAGPAEDGDDGVAVDGAALVGDVDAGDEHVGFQGEVACEVEGGGEAVLEFAGGGDGAGPGVEVGDVHLIVLPH